MSDQPDTEYYWQRLEYLERRYAELIQRERNRDKKIEALELRIRLLARTPPKKRQ